MAFMVTVLSQWSDLMNSSWLISDWSFRVCLSTVEVCLTDTRHFRWRLINKQLVSGHTTVTTTSLPASLEDQFWAEVGCTVQSSMERPSKISWENVLCVEEEEDALRILLKCSESSNWIEHFWVEDCFLLTL
jgi:hypothetical protein